MKKLLALLLIINATFHVNAMLFDPADRSTSGAILYYTQDQTKFVVLRKYYKSRQEFPNVASYGPLFEWEGHDQKEPRAGSQMNALLSLVALKKAAQHEGAYSNRAFTLFTAADESFDCIRQIPDSDGLYGAVVTKKLTDFYHHQGSLKSPGFYKNPDTKELFYMPEAFHETFQKAFFHTAVPQDAESDEK